MTTQKLEIFDFLLFIYGLPVTIWFVSTIQGLSGPEKCGATVMIMIILFGMEMIIKSILQPIKARRFKSRDFSPEYHVSLLDQLSPNITMEFIVSFIVGGLIGYMTLEQHLLIFIASGVVFFVCTEGLRLLFSDLLSQLSKSQTIRHKVKHFLLNIVHSKEILVALFFSMVGVYLTYVYLSDALTHILFSAMNFALVGWGTALFKTK